MAEEAIMQNMMSKWHGVGRSPLPNKAYHGIQ